MSKMNNAEVVMEVKAVSYTRDSRGETVNKHFKDIVNTIHQSTGSVGNTDCLVAEPIMCAMRGRNPDNPSERAKSNGRYKQRLEMNDKGTSNTITSVQKDNLVVEPRIINPLKGQSDNGRHFEQQVYDAEGIARAVKAGEGSGNIPKVIEPQVLTPNRTEFGKAIRKKYESHEIVMSRHDMTTMEPRTDGVSNTLTSAQKDNYLAIPEATSKGYAEAKEFIEQVRGHEEMRYRIRKLTPRECFRLMGVDDADIDKIQGAGISNSQQYKMAGNSIIVDTLYYIIRKLFVDKGCEQEGHQQTLF